ncbi:Uncharacterized protein FWK35_00013858, partial [Aphis craccivora]
TYINGKNGTLRFYLQIWNVRYQTINNSHRTNNFSKGYGIVHSINWFDRLIQVSGVFCDLCIHRIMCYCHLNKNIRKNNRKTQNRIHTNPVYSTKIK